MARPDTSTSTSTKTLLLDSAERLFALRGIDGTSLRAITQDAGTNVASVNYHFGSKQGLVKAVFSRRLRPLNRRRIEMLERALEESDRSLRLRRVLHALVAPVLEMRFDRSLGNPDFVQLMGRTFAESPEQPRRELLEEFEQVLGRFLSALSEIKSEWSREVLAWRFHFTLGAMIYTIAVGRPVSELFQDSDLPPSSRVDLIIQELVDFLESAWNGNPSPDFEDAS
ncbi:MAG: TetR family transcriptional regulator [Acidobacteriota bacterium]